MSGFDIQRLIKDGAFVHYDELADKDQNQVVSEFIRHGVRVDLERIEAEAEMAQLQGLRVRRTAAEYALVPQPGQIMDRVLAAEINLLGGKEGTGKSLLARDWAMCVASGYSWLGCAVPKRRDVVWVASEGLFDFDTRFVSHPLWAQAKDHIHIEDVPINLVRGGDVDWFLKTYADVKPGLVVFDVIYGMGMADDNGVKDVLPLLTSLKRISAEFEGGTLAIGHPGHNSSERRLRGSSMWRNLAYTDYFMGSDQFTCEKSKIANKANLSSSYRSSYPTIDWTASAMGQMNAEAARRLLIESDICQRPHDTDAQRARRLMGSLKVGDRRARELIGNVRRSMPS